MAASPTTAATSEPVWATPGLLIYDGDCGFCTSSASWYSDRAQRSNSVAPWQGLDLDAYGLTTEDVAMAAYWADGGQTWRGADGIARALTACPGIWSWVGRAMAVPPGIWIARALYPVIAKNRHRLPGSTDACRLD